MHPEEPRTNDGGGREMESESGPEIEHGDGERKLEGKRCIC
jgi:hypothetical protein